jgi:hypothetical protein
MKPPSSEQLGPLWLGIGVYVAGKDDKSALMYTIIHVPISLDPLQCHEVRGQIREGDRKYLFR